MADAYLYIDIPTPIFKARVNMPGTITYPITSLVFDGVTLGAFGDVVFDMTLLLGSADGLDDLGRTRVQNNATSTTIPLMRTSQGLEDGELTVVDNAYITVLNDYRVWSKIPYIDDDGIQYKDTTVPVGTFTAGDEPPIANCGPGFAATIDSGTSLITVAFDGSASLAIADGATISTYNWDVDDGTITVGTSASATITATFPAGFRWVALTVTDSNGNPHTSRCPVLAVDPEDDPTTHAFDAEARISERGQEFAFNIKESIPQDTYPDGALILFWEGTPASAADRSHMKLIGWEQNNDNDSRAVRVGNVTGTVLNAVDVAGRMAALPGFPQSLERNATPDNWDKMVNPTMRKYIHYLIQWHSTAVSLADVFLPTYLDSDYPFVIFASEGESLYDQVENEAKAIVPAHHLTCNGQGQLSVIVDPQLQYVALRTTDVQAAFAEEYMESIRFAHTRPPRTHWLRGHALLTATGYTDVDGVDTLLTVHCIAPGDAPGQGLGELETSEGLAQSQVALNSAKGHEYARLNARYGRISVTPASDVPYIDVDPAALTWVTLTLTSVGAAQRGLTFSTARCLPLEIRRRWQARRTGTLRHSEFTLEVETSGTAAVTTSPAGTEYTPPETTPPDFGLLPGQDLVAGIGETSLYRTADFTTVSGSGGPTWTEHNLTTSEEILSWVVDPFSPGYLDGVGAINGWVVTAEALYRVTDIFGTVGCTAIHTFAVALGTSSVPAQEWRTVQASFGAFFAAGVNPWLMVVSHYRDAAGHTGTWAIYSVDGGTTWSSEVQISAHYDAGLGTSARPIALYLSPKTPGYALAVAYSATADPAPAGGYVSSNWGASWTPFALVNTGVRLGGDYHVPWLASGDSTIYHGRMTGGTATDPLLMPLWWKYDDEAGVSTELGLAGEMTLEHTVVDLPGGGTTTGDVYLMLGMLRNTVRVEIAGSWAASVAVVGGTNSSGSITLLDETATTVVNDLSYTHPANNSSTSGSWTQTVTLTSGADWPESREDWEAASPVGAQGVQFRMVGVSNAFGSGASVTVTQSVSVRVTEIELDDGTIYVPVADSTRAFSLRRVNPDTSIDDLSPLSGAVNFGPNAYGFRLRAHDNDANYLVVAVTGNDVSADAADDTQAVFVSDDAGATWTEIVAPAASTEAFAAAFGATDPAEIYLWGPAAYFGFSTDFGSSIDSRAGNLSALSATALRGICGGPPP